MKKMGGGTMKGELRKPAMRTPRLFDRVAAILEDARAGVVRTVNTRMVIAYWLIGREIVQEEQGGKKRAGYGDALLEDLSRRLTERYGRGYSVTNLKNFRTFHQVYLNRLPPIRHSTSDELVGGTAIRHTTSAEAFGAMAIRQLSTDELAQCGHAGFAPQLSFQHYLNGGCVVSDQIHWFNAHFRLGLGEAVQPQLAAMLARQGKPVFPNGGSFQNGIANTPRQGAEFFDWNGQPTGYEGHLVFSWFFLQGVLTQQPEHRNRIFRTMESSGTLR